ncbi:IclR family transcriptional regulator domain-containing protein [Streptomyces sp. NPDC004050]
MTLDSLCQQLGAAVYYSQYTGGEVRVLTSASNPTAPPAIERVPFPHVAHASAVGKSLLAQLDFTGRMDHLARYKPFALTTQTITDREQLSEALDGHGPQAAQFDLLEYSDREICAAIPLTTPSGAPASPCPCPPTNTHGSFRQPTPSASTPPGSSWLYSSPNTPRPDPPPSMLKVVRPGADWHVIRSADVGRRSPIAALDPVVPGQERAVDGMLEGVSRCRFRASLAGLLSGLPRNGCWR